MNQKTLVGIIAAIALIVGIAVSVVITPPGNFTATGDQVKYLNTYPAPRDITPFSLTKHDGAPFTNENLINHWTLAFVGYTYCPDICPVTLSSLAKAYPTLKRLDTSAPLQVLFLSVDPNRDTSERLAEYMSFFNSEFIAATGPHKDLFPLVRNLGMMYAIADSTDNPNYLVDHSASVIVINPKAQVIGRFKPELKPGELAISDVEQILADMPAILDGSY